MSIPPQNDLLTSLPAALYDRILPDLDLVHFRQGEVLHKQDGPITHTQFPVSGVISMVLQNEGGHTIEVGMAGHEGMVGIPLLPGNRSPWQAICQVTSDCLVVETGQLLKHAGESAELHLLVLRYMGFLHRLAAQNIACNRFHVVSQRAARWLLMIRDRSHSNEIDITQEFLAQMLGVHRPNVTAVLTSLKQLGLIERTRRGRVILVDDAGLETTACECYERIRTWGDHMAA
jgi:CRP-like cAMP-binding protein